MVHPYRPQFCRFDDVVWYDSERAAVRDVAHHCGGWLILALFFDWVVQISGLGAVQAAVILALAQIIGTGMRGVMMEGMAFGDALISAGFGMLFWVVSAGVYGWLSD